MLAGIYNTKENLGISVICDRVSFGYANGERIANVILAGLVLYTISDRDLLWIIQD